MLGFTSEQKGELKEIVGGAVKDVVEPIIENAVGELAHMTQNGISEMSKEFGKVYERLNTLEDKISYSNQSFSLLTRDLEQTKTRVTRLEQKVGITD